MAYMDGFDANKVDPSEPALPIPEGKYLATVFESARKDNKNGSGQHLEVKFRIQDGEYKNRVITNRFNLWHQSEKAKSISWGEMSALCRATGVMKPNDSSDLHNIPLEIAVGVTNPDDKGRIYNEINGYAKRGVPCTNTPPPSSEGDPAPGWLQ